MKISVSGNQISNDLPYLPVCKSTLDFCVKKSLLSYACGNVNPYIQCMYQEHYCLKY